MKKFYGIQDETMRTWKTLFTKKEMAEIYGIRMTIKGYIKKYKVIEFTLDI